MDELTFGITVISNGYILYDFIKGDSQYFQNLADLPDLILLRRKE